MPEAVIAVSARKALEFRSSPSVSNTIQCSSVKRNMFSLCRNNNTWRAACCHSLIFKRKKRCSELSPYHNQDKTILNPASMSTWAQHVLNVVYIGTEGTWGGTGQILPVPHSLSNMDWLHEPNKGCVSMYYIYSPYWIPLFHHYGDD